MARCGFIIVDYSDDESDLSDEEEKRGGGGVNPRCPQAQVIVV
jgi:hypothetical protein